MFSLRNETNTACESSGFDDGLRSEQAARDNRAVVRHAVVKTLKITGIAFLAFLALVLLAALIGNTCESAETRAAAAEQLEHARTISFVIGVKHTITAQYLGNVQSDITGTVFVDCAPDIIKTAAGKPAELSLSAQQQIRDVVDLAVNSTWAVSRRTLGKLTYDSQKMREYAAEAFAARKINAVVSRIEITVNGIYCPDADRSR